MYRFRLFYEHDIKSYSIIIISEFKNKIQSAVDCFITKNPLDRKQTFIHIIETDKNDNHLYYTRLIINKFGREYMNHPIEKFYYNYPYLAKNYLVHMIKNQQIFIKYFNDIFEAYKFMKYEFYNYCNKNNRYIEDLITFDHEVSFGGISTKIVENTDDTFYWQEPIKNNDEITKLFENKHLSEGLTFNPTDCLIPDELYFDIKLLCNDKSIWACIICGDNEVCGIDSVIVYNSNYVSANNGKFYELGNIYYTKKGNYCYCKKHNPFRD